MRAIRAGADMQQIGPALNDGRDEDVRVTLGRSPGRPLHGVRALARLGGAAEARLGARALELSRAARLAAGAEHGGEEREEEGKRKRGREGKKEGRGEGRKWERERREGGEESGEVGGKFATKKSGRVVDGRLLARAPYSRRPFPAKLGQWREKGRVVSCRTEICAQTERNRSFSKCGPYMGNSAYCMHFKADHAKLRSF